MAALAQDPALQFFDNECEVSRRGITAAHNLVFIPITLNEGVSEYSQTVVSLATALTDGSVTVQESCNHQTLHVANTSDSVVFALAGSYLRGGGQDRALPISILVPAHASGDVPVRCVEAARWEPSLGQVFQTADVGRIAGSTLFDGSATIDQHTVWESVAGIARSTHTVSSTQCHGETIAQLDCSIRSYTNAWATTPFPKRTVGGIFIAHLGNRHAHCAVDVFGTPELFESHFPRLCESVALTALAGRPRDGHCDYRKGDTFKYVISGVMHNLRCARLSEEQLSMNTGRLFVKIGGKSGCRVSVLQHQGAAIHTMLRWDAKLF